MLLLKLYSEIHIFSSVLIIRLYVFTFSYYTLYWIIINVKHLPVILSYGISKMSIISQALVICIMDSDDTNQTNDNIDLLNFPYYLKCIYYKKLWYQSFLLTNNSLIQGIIGTSLRSTLVKLNGWLLNISLWCLRDHFKSSHVISSRNFFRTVSG